MRNIICDHMNSCVVLRFIYKCICFVLRRMHLLIAAKTGARRSCVGEVFFYRLGTYVQCFGNTCIDINFEWAWNMQFTR